jgi:hypothetical protein
MLLITTDLSGARTSRKQTPEAIENAAAARRGKKRTPEQCAKMSMKRLSTEHRAKISLSLLGNKRARGRSSNFTGAA